MNKKPLFFALSFLVSSLSVPSFSSGLAPEETAKPPVAKKVPKTLAIHGQVRIDEYYWLNERNNPQVIDYLNAENAYTDAQMKHTEKLQEILYREMIGRMEQRNISAPYFENGYWYYSRYEAGKDYPLYCRKAKTLKAREEVILNCNSLAKGHKYFMFGEFDASPDNTVLAYSVDTSARRQFKICFKNLKTGKMYPEEITMALGFTGDRFLAWANDSRTVFYSVLNDALRSFKIFRHKLGTPVKEDHLVYHEKDDSFFALIKKSRSGKYLIIHSFNYITSETLFLDADQPRGEFTVFQPRSRNLFYEVDHFNDRFYIYTNAGAPNYRLMEAFPGKTAKENWRELVPHRGDVLLEGYLLFQDFLVLREREKGLSQIRVMPWKEKQGYCLQFPDPSYMANFETNAEAASDLLRYTYTSLTTPSSIYEFNMKTKEQKLLKQQEVVGGYRPDEYQSERLYVPGYDGTRVPVSLVYKKNLRQKGGNPLLLVGYGAFGVSYDPVFLPDYLSLLDRGFIFAIAHIRGGQEMGRYWYEDGKLFHKMNTFTDFISCGEYLVRHGYTSPDRMFASGRSGGGLLMAAVVNLQPDLFRGVIAGVPFVDAVTTMLDTSIPLSALMLDELGNPNQPDDYEYLLSYSPYDNVRPKAYPAMLVTGGLHDSQVQYWEPAKWVAKLRAMKTDHQPLYLAIDMEAGHFGTSGRFNHLKKTAMTFAFILDLLGITQ